MIRRDPGDGALGLLPEGSAMPIGPDYSWGRARHVDVTTRRAVGDAALVLWEASPLRRRNASHSSMLFLGEASPVERSCASRSASWSSSSLRTSCHIHTTWFVGGSER